MTKKDAEGDFVIVRGPPGVYAGYLQSEDATGNVVLSDAFCLWYYAGAASLNQLALEGVKRPSECKFSVSVPVMRLKQIFQVIPVSAKAKENLLGVRRWLV